MEKSQSTYALGMGIGIMLSNVIAALWKIDGVSVPERLGAWLGRRLKKFRRNQRCGQRQRTPRA